jgi:formate dehydrogenase iron-sulfur subunit
MGCRYCMMACPYGIPRYDWDQPVPYIQKCILCYDRIIKGDQPACVEACPTQATIFGVREELVAEAHQRIRENPGKYIDRVWGEKEIGGSQVLYISDIDLSFLTYNRPLGEKPVPKRTAAAMNAVPFAFLGVGSAMAGISWIIGRRMKLQKNSFNEPEEKGDE